MPASDATPAMLLRQSLRAGSRARELSIVRLVASLLLIAIPLVLAIFLARKTWLVWPAVLTLSGLAAIYGLEAYVLNRGWYRPWVSWLNVVIETSLPVPFLLGAAIYYGPQEYQFAPIQMGWAGLVITSSLRARPWLPVAMGLVAAAEWLIIYLGWVQPFMVTPPGEWVAVGMRAGVLVAAGILGELITRTYLAKADDALRAVREQDLMGKYVLHERLASGGMGEVFRATYCPEGGFRKVVAVKRVLPSLSDDPAFRDLLIEEARLCASLAHPNLVQVLDCGRFNGAFVLAMEYVEGTSLAGLIRVAPLPLPAVAFIGAELAGALDYLHRRIDEQGHPARLLHRDVNPPNVLISRFGEVKLLDFGIASTGEERKSPKFFGKLEYVAPEQLVGAPTDPRSDLFSLGLMLYEAISGSSAYEAGCFVAGVFQSVPPLPPSVPTALSELIAQLCEREPDHRPADAAEVRARLLALEGPAAVREGTDLLRRRVREWTEARKTGRRWSSRPSRRNQAERVRWPELARPARCRPTVSSPRIAEVTPLCGCGGRNPGGAPFCPRLS